MSEQMPFSEGYRPREVEPSPKIRAAIFDSGGVLSRETVKDIMQDISQTLGVPREKVRDEMHGGLIIPLMGLEKLMKLHFGHVFKNRRGLTL